MSVRSEIEHDGEQPTTSNDKWMKNKFVELCFAHEQWTMGDVWYVSNEKNSH